MFIAILFFLFMSFFLSGSETALTAVNKMKIKTRAENNDPRSERLLKMLSKPDELITAILIGNNIANIMLPTLVTVIAIEYGFNVGLATGILTVVLIVFAEVLPKSIASSLSERISYLVFPVIRMLMIILKPLTYLLSRFTRFFIKLLSKSTELEVTVSKEDLITMVDIATTEGIFLTEEQQRIKRVIDFYQLDVRDALKTPRVEIAGIPHHSTFEEAREIIMENSYTRYPVFRGDMDNIVGVFNSKVLLEWFMEPEKTLSDFMDNDPLFVFESHSVERVFKTMLKERKHLAVVVDEYGGTEGIITHEDIIELMIGQEIRDETDEEEENLITIFTENHIMCNGKVQLHKVNDVLQSDIPEDEDVLSGFLLKKLGDFPVEGDQYQFEDLHFKVKKVEENTIRLVEIMKRNEPKET